MINNTEIDFKVTQIDFGGIQYFILFKINVILLQGIY
jgi:hypothetical protein